MNPVNQKAKKIRLLLLDVDGILTDGRIFYNERGREIKGFHVQDGQGIRWLFQVGIEVGFLSGRSSSAVSMRAKELEVSLLFQGVKDKVNVAENLLEKKKLQFEQIAFMGDDFIDLPLLKRVGFSLSVPNAHSLVRREVDYITRSSGGNGAVREAAELLIKAQGQWKFILNRYGIPG